MLSGGALPQTLGSITATKINELSKQRNLFEKRRHEITKAAEDATDLRTKARILLEGVTRLKGYPNVAIDRHDLDADVSAGGETYVKDLSEGAVYANIRRFLLQSQYDPSVSERSLKGWISKLEKELEFLQLRHEHASFYSDLVTEWLGDLEGEAASTAASAGESSASFEQVGRAEMHEQRAKWESLVFTEADIDATAIRKYLDDIFEATNQTQQALKALRDRLRSFGTDFASKKTWFKAKDLTWISKSLLSSDLLTKEKTAVLKEFMRNPAVAQEVADVLNMRLSSLDTWTWPSEGIPVEMRRQLNGKYRVFMDEDLLDSLMFQYLGVRWSVALRSAFEEFLGSPAWKSPRDQISEEAVVRRSRFRRESWSSSSGAQSVHAIRKNMFKEDYFMTSLPSSVEETSGPYAGEEADDEEESNKQKKNGLEIKHSLLHLLITESLIYTSLHGEFTAIRSDFEYFGPSLAHTTISTVLEYFGVPQTWLHFFDTFLKAPISFVQDGSEAHVSVRRRGVPMSHKLSDFFGEAVLFCMDFAVNQNTDGGYLYRLHDDFWFWGHEGTCVKAWQTMTSFAEVTGLTFNEEKTGTTRFVAKHTTELDGQSTPQPKPRETSSSSVLPKGDIRWGFLKLDPEEGRFIIDQAQVDSHISELQRQLSSCKSIFAWVQAWNSYFGRFFANNFAKPAMCFGRSHIDMAISTLNRIERSLFPVDASGVTDYLRHEIAKRFNVHDLPEGFFYFPAELGGIELLNPYIPFLSMRENIKHTPEARLRKAFIEDEAEYLAAKERYERDGPLNSDYSNWGAGSEVTSAVSLEEYTQYRETYSRPLLEAYEDLIRVPEEESVDQTAKFQRHQMSLDEGIEEEANKRKIISGDWWSMLSYWRWAAELYYEDMTSRYGNLAAVNREYMPLGVIKTLKEGKFRWQS
ncbi:uncharacterized protein BP01DRAFT_146994 [Aspergillus saccharolyticus JOP 1030-1]|uniref:Reverse transcriptase domain-containing protein n=1 Tax=Aspergillus saccharolyticus JOP 1030-1 TaxID=1450539 RepID=A0A319A9M3_9EURO|nr:hypothetical protein BP01DRAFT_146994 [Aspergillus saccharolyticus JOP 1030-1]PYH48398.1 hypothetical protein BP01DRAFT_146994 [Aspergillus saccharolyticus JOP 1030-1]